MGNERTSEFVDRDGDRYVAQRDGKYLQIQGGPRGNEGCVDFWADDAANVCRMISEAAGIEYAAPDARTIARAEAAEARAAALSEVVDKLAARLGPMDPATTLPHRSASIVTLRKRGPEDVPQSGTWALASFGPVLDVARYTDKPGLPRHWWARGPCYGPDKVEWWIPLDEF